MKTLIRAAGTELETRPAAPATIPAETFPSNPNDPFGVDEKIIEEIQEIGRRHAEPQE